MNGDIIAKALEAELAGLTVYADGVPESPSYPYVVVTTNFPEVAERSRGRTVLARLVRSRTTAVGLSSSAVRVIAGKLSGALEGKRITADGWQLGAIESVPNGQGILPDLDVTIPPLNVNPLYQPFDWVLTATPA